MKYWALLGTFFLAVSSLSQQSDTVLFDKEPMSMAQFFSQGNFSGNFRSFTLSTINYGDLNDYFTNAAGASISYKSARFYGLMFGLTGDFVFKTFSNDLNRIDTLVGKASSYEMQLYDVENPTNFKDLSRLQELYVDYSGKKINIKLGRQKIATPMVNEHDGRMVPKVFSGVNVGYTPKVNLRFNAYYLVGASPRSTMRWNSLENDIGIYSNGYLWNGDKASYHNYVQSNGLGILGMSYKLKKCNYEIWNYYLDNIVNSTLLKVGLEKDTGFYGGVMGMIQLPLGNGGSNDLDHTYYLPNTQTYAVSGMLGYTQTGYSGEIAGTWISNHGRFTFPREFGVDPFYTFISRSQLEGFGDALAWRFTTGKTIKNWDLKLHWVSVKTSSDYALNKYGIPSYWQLNTDINWRANKTLKGLSMRFLYVYRGAFSNEISPIQRFNKSDFHQFNFILNYAF